MLNYKLHIAEKISSIIAGFLKQEIAILLEYPANPDKGDLSLPCFQLSKSLRRSPQAIADELKEKMMDELIDHVDSVSGYLNIYLNKVRFNETVIKGIFRGGSTIWSSRHWTRKYGGHRLFFPEYRETFSCGPS
jgi:arginyl-tRNA synthetase